MKTFSEIDKKPIAPILSDMEIGDEECYPIERLLSVRGTIERVSKQLKRKYSTSTSEDTICVTRTE